MREVALVGAGMTRFTKQADVGHEALAVTAASAAVEDAGVPLAEVGAAFAASMGGGPAIAQRALRHLGLAGIPMVNVENACASSSTALVEAVAWIRAGMCDVALAMGVEIVSVQSGPLDVPDTGSGQWVFDTGLNLPAWYGLKASRHMAEHGLTREELAAVAVKSRRLSVDNPLAHFRSPVTVEEVLGSATVADPLTLFQCCPKTDGASAVVVCSADYAAARGLDPVWIRGLALVSGRPVFRDRPDAEDATRRSARLAYEQAGVDPADVDVAECHDAFTIGEVLATEALGFCPLGDGGAWIAAGATSPGGKGPVMNPSGGMLSRGHPIAASGLAQTAEVMWQLRGRCGTRQVDGARMGVVHTMGASEFELDANACVVQVLEQGRQQ
jgi:acetyl-CoA acetyltransferase